MKVLLIGGPADGTVQDARGMPEVLKIVENEPGKAQQKNHFYRREVFKEEPKVFLVYVHDSVPLGAMFARLVAGYLVTQPRAEPALGEVELPTMKGVKL